MTLQDLSNIAQVVNSIAVVVTIVYLATQVRLLAIQARENTRLAQLTLQENFTSAQQETCLRVAENPEMYRIWMVGTAAGAQPRHDPNRSPGQHEVLPIVVGTTVERLRL